MAWDEPTPLPVPNWRPGCCFASAVNSESVPTPSEGCAASTIGWREICTTGINALSGSMAIL